MWILLPISYSIIIQILTGIPKPDALKDAAVHELFIEISEGIFDYPFWLQDLSHFPLSFYLHGFGHGIFEDFNKQYQHCSVLSLLQFLSL